MAIYAGDAIILTAFRRALEDLRAKRTYLAQDAMSQFITDPLLQRYYADQIPSYESFLQNVNINLVMETRLKDDAKFPVIAIGIGSSSEDTQKGSLGDSQLYNVVPAQSLGGALYEPELIIVPPTTPLSYDATTGLLTFANSLPDVFPGQFVRDEVNNISYEILLVLSSTQLMLDPALKANFTGMTIRPLANVVIHNRKIWWAWENYTVKCLSTDPTELMQLYTTVYYILGRYKKALFEHRGYEINTVNVGEVYNASPDGTQQLFGRDFQLRGRCQHTFIETTDLQIQGANTDLLIEGPPSPPDILTQVENQGWEMTGDFVPTTTTNKEEI
jgi:hypothetical protein